MADQLLSQNTIKCLSDKLYEKRRLGVAEVENLVRTMSNRDSILKVIEAITTSFCQSLQTNSRKGGLMALAAIVLALQPSVGANFLDQVLPPILVLFVDSDSKVRFQAVESLLNVVKVQRDTVLPYFDEIFAGLSHLVGDQDSNVRLGAETFNQVFKDVCTESKKLDVPRVVGLLKSQLATSSPEVQLFVVGWVKALVNIPDVSMVDYIPDLAPGLFALLGEEQQPVRNQAKLVLDDLLHEVKQMPNVDFSPILNTILPITCKAAVPAREVALFWLRELLVQRNDILLPFVAEILHALLICISGVETRIREIAFRVNDDVQHMVGTTTLPFGLAPVVRVLLVAIVRQSVPTRSATLQWIRLLLNKHFDAMFVHLDELFPMLLKTLSDGSDEVLSLDLEVLAQLSMQRESIFTRFMSSLVELFSTDHKLLGKAGLIVRQLTLLIDAEKVFRSLASILENEADTEFASIMIQTLNAILLTSKEMTVLRTRIKHSMTDATGRDVFVALYQAWCRNPIAVLSLCLLAQAYGHAARIVLRLSEFEITVNLLVEVDKLVQLIESPVFAHVRLQLCEPQLHPDLLKALYGLLMLLPQSNAYDVLAGRLSNVTTLALVQLLQEKRGPNSMESAQWPLDFDKLLEHFVTVQRRDALAGTRGRT